jgi:hypothetical protein
LLFAFFFFKCLLSPPRCCFVTLLLAFIPWCYAFLCQLVFFPHFLMQVEELGTTSTRFIQQAKVLKNSNFFFFFPLCFVYICFVYHFFNIIFLV